MGTLAILPFVAAGLAYSSYLVFTDEETQRLHKIGASLLFDKIVTKLRSTFKEYQMNPSKVYINQKDVSREWCLKIAQQVEIENLSTFLKRGVEKFEIRIEYSIDQEEYIFTRKVTSADNVSFSLKKPKSIPFRRSIAMAVINDKIDVTNVVKKFAGPSGNFYQNNVLLCDIVSEVDNPILPNTMTITDTFGEIYQYEFQNEFVINWPLDANKHKKRRE